MKKTNLKKGRDVSVLRMRRLRADSSLVDMAKKVGITHPYMSMIERGFKVTKNLRDRVCKWYGVPEKEAFFLLEKSSGGKEYYSAVML